MYPLLLDARILSRPPTGIRRYTEELARRLAVRGFALSALVDSDTPAPEWAVEVLRAKSAFLSPKEQLELPVLVARWRRRVGHRATFFVPSYNIAALAPCDLAVTIHDANHLAFPELYGLKYRAYYQGVVRLAAQRARVIFTPSEFAKSELVERIGVPGSRCVVTPLGAPDSPRPSEEAIAKTREDYGLSGEYVLYVGNFKPHKNLPLLLNSAPAFAPLATLVLVGGEEAELGEELKAARAQGAQIQVIPRLDDAALWAMLAGAKVFAFPSVYEGFGLPPLEAMSLGVPVVASRAASIPEVTKEAAILVDPGNPRAFGAEIRKVLEEPALAESLASRGLKRAAQMTWESTADLTAEALLGH